MRFKGIAAKGIAVLGVSTLLALSVPLSASATTYPIGARSCSSPRTVQTHSYSNGAPQHHQVVGGVDYSTTFPVSYTTQYHRYWNRGSSSASNTYIIVVEYTTVTTIAATCEV